MIGIDTNILARYILDDDPEWTDAAVHFIDEVCTEDSPGFVNPVVLAELVWLLTQQAGFGRPQVTAVIRDFLLADNLVIGNQDVVEHAMMQYEKGPADFADYLIAGLNAASGAAPTATIDKKAAKGDGYMRLKKRASHG